MVAQMKPKTGSMLGRSHLSIAVCSTIHSSCKASDVHCKKTRYFAVNASCCFRSRNYGDAGKRRSRTCLFQAAAGFNSAPVGTPRRGLSRSRAGRPVRAANLCFPCTLLRLSRCNRFLTAAEPGRLPLSSALVARLPDLWKQTSAACGRSRAASHLTAAPHWE